MERCPFFSITYLKCLETQRSRLILGSDNLDIFIVQVNLTFGYVRYVDFFSKSLLFKNIVFHSKKSTELMSDDEEGFISQIQVLSPCHFKNDYDRIIYYACTCM